MVKGKARMTATNGWPNVPGVPLNPKQNGAHKLGQYFVVWRADTQDYVNHNGNVLPPEVAGAWPYLGPCLTPDEVQNLRDDLASAERERAHQHGRADRNAAEYAREQGKRETLQARVAELEGALKDAAASVKEWGAYASQYLQDKWDLSGEVARYIAIAEGKNDAALTGGKDE